MSELTDKIRVEIVDLTYGVENVHPDVDKRYITAVKCVIEKAQILLVAVDALEDISEMMRDRCDVVTAENALDRIKELL